MTDKLLNEGGWIRVDKDAFKRGLDIIAAAARDHPNDRKAYRAAIERANAEIGVKPKRGRR